MSEDTGQLDYFVKKNPENEEWNEYRTDYPSFPEPGNEEAIANWQKEQRRLERVAAAEAAAAAAEAEDAEGDEDDDEKD